MDIGFTACCNLFPLPHFSTLQRLETTCLSPSLRRLIPYQLSEMDFLRNWSHLPKILSTSQVPAALSFGNSLTDTYLPKFQSLLPNLLLVLEFVSSVHWPEERLECQKSCGFFLCAWNLVWLSVAMAVDVIKKCYCHL